MPRRDRNLLQSSLPKLYEQRRVPEKLLASWRKRGARFVPDKQGSPELLLQETYSRAHGGLANIQPLRSPNEAAR